MDRILIAAGAALAKVTFMAVAFSRNRDALPADNELVSTAVKGAR